MKSLYRFLIRFYQARISPRKGYRCAYSVEHGGPGCSGAVLGILESKGLLGGLPDIRGRFADCSAAAEERRRRRKGGSGCGGGLDNACDAADCVSDGCPSISMSWKR